METEIKDGTFERHVVLVSPDVHWNTGNIGRTCIGTNSFLHLIKPLGFSIESSEVKRAGLDYWHKVKLHVWENFQEFLEEFNPAQEEIVLLTKNGEKCYWDIPKVKRQFLIFGSETRGLPEEILDSFKDQTFHIPILDEIRSLNLSTSVGIVLYESLKGINLIKHGWVV